MTLSISIIDGAKPTDKPVKMFDEKGMFLLVMPNGSKYWRMKYRFERKEKTLSLGVYPFVSLDEAREQRSAFRAMLYEGIDPAEQVKMQRAAAKAEDGRKIAPTRFTLGNDGALTVVLGNRRLSLTPDETVELRSFLVATRAVSAKDEPCR